MYTGITNRGARSDPGWSVDQGSVIYTQIISQSDSTAFIGLVVSNQVGILGMGVGHFAADIISYLGLGKGYIPNPYFIHGTQPGENVEGSIKISAYLLLPFGKSTWRYWTGNQNPILIQT